MSTSTNDPRDTLASTFTFRPFLYYWTGTLILQTAIQTQTLFFAWEWSGQKEDNSFWVYFAGNAPFVALTLFVGYLGDLYSRKVLHAVGQILILFGFIITINYETDRSLSYGLLVVLLINCGVAIRGPSYQATLISLFRSNNIERVLSLHGLAINIAKLLGPLLLSLVVAYRFDSLPAAFGIVASLWTILVISFIDRGLPVAPAIRSVASPLGLLGSDRSFLWGLVTAGLIAFCFCGFQTLLPSLVRMHFGGTAIVLTVLASSFSVGTIFGAFAVDFLPSKLRTLEIWVWIAVFGTLVIILTSVDIIALRAFTGTLIGLVFFLTFVKINVVLIRPYPENQRAFRLSLYFFSTYLGNTIGALAWGLLNRIFSDPGISLQLSGFSSLVLACAVSRIRFFKMK